MSHWTEIRPPVPKAMMALLARGSFARKLMVLVPGTGPPVGYSRKSPTSVSPTTVTLIAIALASAGIPQRPTAGKLREVFAARAGPPEGPAGLRVSATRQGVNVKNLPPALVRRARKVGFLNPVLGPARVRSGAVFPLAVLG